MSLCWPATGTADQHRWPQAHTCRNGSLSAARDCIACVGELSADRGL